MKTPLSTEESDDGGSRWIPPRLEWQKMIALSSWLGETGSGQSTGEGYLIVGPGCSIGLAIAEPWGIIGP